VTLEHTHRTHQIRTDYELAALSVMATELSASAGKAWEVDDVEHEFRGRPVFEETVKAIAAWLEEFNPGFKAKPHECGGQLC